jgi:formate-dependent nitrite reductase membrane component NrfD
MPTEHQPAPIASADTGYYGRPLLKAPVWTWEVPLYLFVGGAGGAAAVIAAVSEWTGQERTLVRDAHWLAAISGPASAALLVSDLGRPERFINMMRVFKPRSAMSVGSWTLLAFSISSSAAALASTLAGRDGHAPAAQAAARITGSASAAFGTLLATYTGVLLGATAIPAWNTNVGLLPVHFAAAGVGSAASVLELLGHRDPALRRLGFGAAAVETLIGAAIESNRSVAQSPLREGASGTITRAGGVLSGPVAMIARGIGRDTRTQRAAAICAIVGSILTRMGWLAAGKRSARDPRPALRLREGAPSDDRLMTEAPIGATSA